MHNNISDKELTSYCQDEIIIVMRHIFIAGISLHKICEAAILLLLVQFFSTLVKNKWLTSIMLMFI